MIACQDCGAYSDDADAFCGSCGGFLEWSGEKVVVKPTSPAVREEMAEEARRRPGLLQRMQSMLYLDVGRRDPLPRPAGGTPGARPPGLGSGLGGVGAGTTPGGQSPAPGVPPAAAKPGAGRPPGLPPAPGRAGRPPGAPAARPGGPAGLPPAPPPGARSGTVPGTPPGFPPAPGAGGPTQAGSGPASPGARLPGPPRPPGVSASPARPRPPGVSTPPGVTVARDRPRPPGVSAPPGVPGPPGRPGEQKTAGRDALPDLVVPVPDRARRESSDPDGLEPVLPQPVRIRRPADAPKAPTRRGTAGDRICGECGEPNTPTRKFCHRCGDSLASATVVRAPWWRRLLPRRRAPKVVRSGLHPGERADGTAPSRSFGERLVPTVRLVVGLVLLVLGTVYAVHPPFQQWVNGQVTTWKTRAINLVVPQYIPVNPSSAALAPGRPDDSANPVAHLIDGFSNTHWLAPVKDGRAPVVVLTFSVPVSIDRALVRNGAGDEFRSYHRAKDVHLVYSDGRTFDLVLKDSPEPQEVPVADADGVTTVEVHVMSVYQSVEGNHLALTEIEFFARG